MEEKKAETGAGTAEENQKELEKLLEQFEKKRKSAVPFAPQLLHLCSSYVLEYLSQYFHITVFYYNPNIYPDSEYEKRVQEQKRTD